MENVPAQVIHRDYLWRQVGPLAKGGGRNRRHGNQHHSESDKYDRQYAAHRFTSRSSGSRTGNSRVSARRRRSGTTITSSKAIIALSMGSVPHSSPSAALGINR